MATGDMLSDSAELQLRLPAALRQRYKVLELLPTAGAEADLFRVQGQADLEIRVIKLYRQGMHGDEELLAKLKQAHDPHVIRINEAGVSDGVRFEVMEYIAQGSLRQLLESGPVSVDRIREIVSEIGQALARVQAMNILHRDLKPENVLVRTLSPLSLVLTDFGIASVRMGTQHFTSGARTTRYAAPEALTGVIDERADWWSLGMIVLEAAVGRHPFEGLNEQIVNHQLATKPVDVRTVFHDELRKLCRGLLMRDPRARWSWPEVQRWLAGDPTLVEVQEGAVNAALRAYRIADSQCTTAIELAVTLVKHWQIGAKDLVRGTVGTWLEEQLHDHNLLRKLQDILDMRGVSDDWRLLKFVLVVVPDIPAVWKGTPVSRESLLIAARKASNGDRPSAAWLHSIHSEGVLEALSLAGRPEVSAFRQQWLQGLERFAALWEKGRDAEDRWRREPKAWYGSSQVVVDVDYALYLQSSRMNQPPVERLHGHVLLAVCLPAFVSMVRSQLVGEVAASGDICPWFATLGPMHELDAVGVIVAKLLLPMALEDMSCEQERLSSAHHQGEAGGEGGTGLLMREIQCVVDLLRAGLRTQGARFQLREALEDLQNAGYRVIRLAPTEGGDAKVRSSLDSLMSASIAMQAELDAVDATERINAIWFSPRRLAVGGTFLMGLWSLLPGIYAVALLVIAATGGAWRYKVLQQTKTALEGRAKSFSRLCEKTMGRNNSLAKSPAPSPSAKQKK
jgi:tRNA A-37 threonylcarbamoyl transferase component Bud32